MAREFDAETGRHRRTVLTPDELVVQLREAGAQRVHLSRTAAFRDGTIPITATYPIATAAQTHDSETAPEREQLVSVFDAIDDHLWFYGREWSLDWAVEPAFTDPQRDLLPLYDRRIEHEHGDGFLLGNLLVVYEEVQALNTEP